MIRLLAAALMTFASLSQAQEQGPGALLERSGIGAPQIKQVILVSMNPDTGAETDSILRKVQMYRERFGQDVRFVVLTPARSHLSAGPGFVVDTIHPVELTSKSLAKRAANARSWTQATRAGETLAEHAERAYLWKIATIADSRSLIDFTPQAGALIGRALAENGHSARDSTQISLGDSAWETPVIAKMREIARKRGASLIVESGTNGALYDTGGKELGTYTKARATTAPSSLDSTLLLAPAPRSSLDRYTRGSGIDTSLPHAVFDFNVPPEHLDSQFEVMTDQRAAITRYLAENPGHRVLVRMPQELPRAFGDAHALMSDGSRSAERVRMKKIDPRSFERVVRMGVAYDLRQSVVASVLGLAESMNATQSKVAVLPEEPLVLWRAIADAQTVVTHDPEFSRIAHLRRGAPAQTADELLRSVIEACVDGAVRREL